MRARSLVSACLLVVFLGSAPEAWPRSLAEARRALLVGDLTRHQRAADAWLRAAGSEVHAVPIARLDGGADLAGTLRSHRTLAPLWLAGSATDGWLLWGNFGSESEARAAAQAWGGTPAGPPWRLSGPLAGLEPPSAEPATPPVVVARNEPERRPEPPPARRSPPPRVIATTPPPTPPPVVDEPAPAPRREEPRPIAPSPRRPIDPIELPPPRSAPSAPVERIERSPIVEAELRPPVPSPDPVVSEAPPPRRAVAQRRPAVTGPVAPDATSVRPAPSRPSLPPPPDPMPTADPAALEAARARVKTALPAVDDADPVARASQAFEGGNAAYTRGEFHEAVAYFEAALQRDADNPRSTNNLGLSWLQLGDAAQAEAAFRRAIELEPDYARAHLNLSGSLHVQGRTDEALGALNKVLALDPENLDAHFNIAALQGAAGRWDDARVALDRGLAINPNDPRLIELEQRLAAEIALAEEGLAQLIDLSESPCAIELAAADRRQRFNRLFRRADQARLRGSWEDAERGFAAALSCQPTHADAANHLGVVRLSQRRALEAHDAFDWALRWAPEHRQARVNRALAAYALGHCEAALTDLDALTTADETWPDGWRELALMHYRCGRPGAAEQAATRGLELGPDERLSNLLDRLRSLRDPSLAG
ncbi:MAG: tetratricopeptide repeat protein [Acidobacteriota bacterium]